MLQMLPTFAKIGPYAITAVCSARPSGEALADRVFVRKDQGPNSTQKRCARCAHQTSIQQTEMSKPAEKKHWNIEFHNNSVSIHDNIWSQHGSHVGIRGFSQSSATVLSTKLEPA